MRHLICCFTFIFLSMACNNKKEQNIISVSEVDANYSLTEDTISNEHTQIVIDTIQEAINYSAKNDSKIYSIKPPHEEAFDESDIFLVVEEYAEFPGGQKALFDYLQKKCTYPKTAIRDSIQGTVYIEFIIETDGSISNVITRRGVRYDLDYESERVIRSMPNWIPGKQYGKPVRVRYNIPLKYSLKESDDTPKFIKPKNPAESNIFDALEFNIFPNPAKDWVNIEIKNITEVPMRYTFFSNSGHIVLTGSLENELTQLDISQLTNGLYIVQIESDDKNQIFTKKLIVK